MGGRVVIEVLLCQGTLVGKAEMKVREQKINIYEILFQQATGQVVRVQENADQGG